MCNNFPTNLPHSPPPTFLAKWNQISPRFSKFQVPFIYPFQKKNGPQKLVNLLFQVDDFFADLWDLWHLFQKLARFTGTFSCLRWKMGSEPWIGSRPPISWPLGWWVKIPSGNSGISTKPHQAQVVIFPDFWTINSMWTVTYPTHTHWFRCINGGWWPYGGPPWDKLPSSTGDRRISGCHQQYLCLQQKQGSCIKSLIQLEN